MARISRPLTLAVVALFAAALVFAQSDPKVGKAQEFINLLNKGNYPKAFEKLDSNLGFNLKSADKLSSIWKKIEEKAGQFKEFRDSKVETLKSGPETFTVVTQVCKFEKGLMDLKVALDSQDKVADFRYLSHKTEGQAGEGKPAGAAPAPPAAPVQ
jgi:hypothetical protein